MEAAPTPESQKEDADLLDQMEAYEQAIAPVISTDASAAFAEESYTWDVATGKFDAEGRAILLRVTVKDPCDPVLPTQYMQALQTKGVDAAYAGLWQACIVEPVSLKNPTIMKRVTTAFRATLTYRLMNLVGINADFFDAVKTIGSRTASPRVTTSSSKSPTSTASTPASLSVSTTPVSSTTPTASPGVAASLTAPAS